MSETGETSRGSSAFGAELSALWPRDRSGRRLRLAKTRKADDAACVDEHGEDLPEIRNWKWSAAK
jgi:phosphoketolase